MSRSQSKAEYGRFAHLFVGGIEWLLSQWQALTGGEETDLHSHAASGGGSGWSLADSQDLVAGESSWSFSLPASGKTHARLLIRVSATPAHEFGLGIRLNGDTTLSHYAGGDADPAATGLGASWRVLLPAGAAATGLLTIDLPFYRLLPLLGLQMVVRPAGGGVVDQVYWNGATPAATVTLLALENTDDNYAAFAARAVDGGVAELWVV